MCSGPKLDMMYVSVDEGDPTLGPAICSDHAPGMERLRKTS
jgi:hypothetical protein